VLTAARSQEVLKARWGEGKSICDRKSIMISYRYLLLG